MDVWPDNWPYVELFRALSTQWRVGFNGPTGLDYNSVPAVLKFLGFPKKEWSEAFAFLQLMEMEALEEMHV